jgi:hypothetical protein
VDLTMSWVHSNLVKVLLILDELVSAVLHLLVD